MSLSNTFETRALQWLFTATAVTRPTAWHVALFTTDPAETGSGTEVSGGGYARLSVGASGLSVSGNLATNATQLEWPAATASWGTVTHIGIMDAPSAGNMIASAPLTTARAIATDDILRFAAGEIDFTLD